MKILLTVPTTGDIHSSIMHAVLRELQYASAPPRGWPVRVDTPRRAPIEHNRTVIAEHAIRDGYDWWLCIDSDNPPATVRPVLELCEQAGDCFVCPTPMTGQCDDEALPMMWNVWGVKEDSEDLTKPLHRLMNRAELPVYRKAVPGVGLERIAAFGTGCFLIRVSTLAKIDVPFASAWDQKGKRIMGSDLWFSRKLREIGADVYVSWPHYCDHFKTTNLRDDLWRTQPIGIDNEHQERAIA